MPATFVGVRYSRAGRGVWFHKVRRSSFEWVGAMCRLQDKVKLKARLFVSWSLYTRWSLQWVIDLESRGI